jgi:hypothetical protein
MMKNKLTRRILSLTIIGMSILVIGYLVISGQFSLGFAPDDFSAYWSSGRLLSLGKDPYSKTNTVALTEAIGFGRSGLILSYFYPPWTLPLFIPFGLLTFQISRTIWFILSVVIYSCCTLWIWKLYGGPARKYWLVIPLILVLSPGIFALIEGQITPLILTGIVGFLYFEKKRRWFLAGSFLALITFKIHILYLFWIVIFLWVIYSKRWSVFAGFFSALAVSSLLISVIRSSVFREFLIMNAYNLPSYCSNPTLSSILCVLNNYEFESWFLLIGPILGMLWLIPYWLRKKDDWQWMSIIPIVIFISLITAPYTWLHDGLLFIIAVIAVTIHFLYQGISMKEYLIIFLLLITNFIIFVLVGRMRINQIFLVWVPLVYLLLYIISNPHIRGVQFPDEEATLNS